MAFKWAVFVQTVIHKYVFTDYFWFCSKEIISLCLKIRQAYFEGSSKNKILFQKLRLRLKTNNFSSKCLPVAQVETGEDNGLKFSFFCDVFSRHVANQQVDEHHVGGIDKSNVLKLEKISIHNLLPNSRVWMPFKQYCIAARV